MELAINQRRRGQEVKLIQDKHRILI